MTKKKKSFEDDLEKGRWTTVGYYPVAQCFAAALKEIVRPRGAKTRLAEEIGISKQYLNGIINQENKKIPDAIKDRIAKVLNTSVYDMILMGNSILKTGYYFPYNEEMKNAPSISVENHARAETLTSLTAKEYHLIVKKLKLFCRGVIFDTALEQYESGKISDAEYYAILTDVFKSLLDYYLKADKNKKR
jgi:transcriptional regulator with XRE-family HTH domain